MRGFFKIVLFLLTFLYAASSSALMPPMTDKELKRDSNLIVVGRITDVRCTGEIEELACATDTGYKAVLEVKKVLKGEKAKKVDLYFMRTEFKEHCIGSPDTLHYVGEEAKYYLRCTAERCGLTHWNGIEYIKEGERTLPKCGK